MSKIKISMILNCLIVILVIFSIIAMMTGFEFTGPNTLLSDTHVNVFKFFTVDSNILAGLSCLLLFVAEYINIKKKKNISKIVSVLKFMGTVSVMLTLIVTLFFLAPSSSARLVDFYQNSNLFFHLIVPLLCLVSFVFYDPIDIKFKDTFFGVIPMLIYAVYYLTAVYTHLYHGKVLWKYDFYGFLKWGPQSVLLVAPIIILFTYLIGLCLWFCYKKVNKK